MIMLQWCSWSWRGTVYQQISIFYTIADNLVRKQCLPNHSERLGVSNSQKSVWEGLTSKLLTLLQEKGGKACTHVVQWVWKVNRLWRRNPGGSEQYTTYKDCGMGHNNETGNWNREREKIFLQSEYHRTSFSIPENFNKCLPPGVSAICSGGAQWCKHNGKSFCLVNMESSKFNST